MRLRKGAVATLPLLALALLGVAFASADTARQGHGKKHRAQIGIAKRIAVDRRGAPKRSFRDRRIGAPRPFGSLANDAISLVAPPAPPPRLSPKTCTRVVADVSTAQAAIRTAAAGAVVCLADGSYAPVSLAATKPALVTLQAQHPGGATLDGITLSGSHLSVERFAIAGEVTVEPGAVGMEIAHNRIGGGYFGVDAGPTATTTIDDTRIVGNELIGPFGEDAIHLNRFHDGDGDGIGVLIEGNEIASVRENGNHSDCLQTVWVGDHLVFRRNYLHDNRCQGFFVKDQDGPGEVSGPVVGIAVEDNLFLRNDAPCAPEAPDCGDPSYFQVFGPYSGLAMRRNTIWGGEPVASFQEGTGADTAIESNVIYRLWTSTDLSGVVYASNTSCQRESSEDGAWPDQVIGETVDCGPAFADPSVDDYRLLGSGRGVDWAPAGQQYGP
jgi:hypothetical protein